MSVKRLPPDIAAQRAASDQKWAAPPEDAALSFPTGKHTSPRREHPQLGNAKLNPGRYDLRRQSARRLAFPRL